MEVKNKPQLPIGISNLPNNLKQLFAHAGKHCEEHNLRTTHKHLMEHTGTDFETWFKS